MIGFYLTTNDSYNPELIEDASNSFIMDFKNKNIKVMNEYVFEFQKLSGTYDTPSADSSSLSLSIYGANKLYSELNSRTPLDASIAQWNSAMPGTVTSITAGTGLSGGTITESGTISLEESGATAGNYGLSSDASVITNASPIEIAIPYITVDAYGRITSITTNTLKVKDTDTVPEEGTYSELETGTNQTPKSWDASTISKYVKETGGATYSKGTISQLNAGTDETSQVWDASTIANYVKTSTELGIRYRDDFDASTGIVGSGTDTLTSLEEKRGDMFIVSSEGTYLNHELQVGDAIIFKKGSSAGVSPIAGNLSFVQGVVKVVDGNATLDWETPVVIGTVEGVQLHVTLPAQPTKADLGLGNVENKSSETIRSEITSINVSTALGYIPASVDELSNYVANASIDTSISDTDNEIPTSKAVKSFVESKGYTTNVGTVTSVGVSVPTGLSVSGTPVTESGTISISLSSGYSIPLDASLNDFQASSHTHTNKSILDEITSTDINNWIDASNDKHTHSNINILNGITDSSVLEWIKDTSYNAITISDLSAGTSEVVGVIDASTIHRYVNNLSGGTVTSIDISMPDYFDVTGGPITNSGVIDISLANGYKIPLDVSLNDF